MWFEAKNEEEQHQGKKDQEAGVDSDNRAAPSRDNRKVRWCREGESNPHRPFGPADFKSAASANFAIPARVSF